jgi:DNA-binding GntR family transcriptional regulator
MPPGLAPLKHDPLHERVYGELRDALMAGRFKPGEVVTVRGLAAALGTSPMPVREALRRLVEAQALEVRRNRSVAVPAMTRRRLEELYRVRMMLEGTAAAWAAERITPRELRSLERLSREIAGHVAANDVPAYLRKNLLFHFAIYRAARPEVLLPLIESLWLQIGPFFNHTAEELDYRLSQQHHEEALAGLVARDPDAARAGIERDIAEAARYLLDVVSFEAAADGPAATAEPRAAK